MDEWFVSQETSVSAEAAEAPLPPPSWTPPEEAPPPAEEPVNDVTLPEAVVSQAAPVEVTTAVQSGKETVDALIKADGMLWTDKEDVLGALRGKSPEEIAEVRRQFQVATGQNLDEYVESSVENPIMSLFRDRGDDSHVQEARAILAGDEVTAATIGLRNATDGLGTDEKKIDAILGSLQDQTGEPDPKKLEQLRAQFEGKGGESLETVLGDELGEHEANAAIAMSKGDRTAADVHRLLDATDRLGTETDAVWKVLDDPRYRDPAKLAELETRFAQTTDDKMAPTLDKLLVGDNNESFFSELSDEDRDRAAALLAGNRLGAEAAKLQATMSGMGTKEGELFKILGEHDAEEQQQLAAQWQLLYGEKTGAASLDAQIQGELEGGSFWNHLLGEGDLDGERAAMLRKNGGKLDDAFALYVAMKGGGTDEKLIKDTLKDRSPAELEKIKKDYAALRVARGDVGDNESAADDLLTQDLVADLGGRDEFEAQQLMAGDVERMGLDEAGKAREIQRRVNESWEHDRGSGAGIASRLVDLLDLSGLDSGHLLDWQHEQVNRVAGAAVRADGSVDPEMLCELRERAGFHDAADQAFVANQDKVVDAVPTVLATGAELALLVGTDGAVTPLMAALAAGTGEELGMLSKLLIKGSNYGGDEMLHDQGKVLAEALAAGTLKLPVGAEGQALEQLIGGTVGNAVGKRTFPAAGKVAGEVAVNVTESGIKNSAADVVLDEGNAHGGDNTAADQVGTVGGGIKAGAGKGAALGVKEVLFGD